MRPTRARLARGQLALLGGDPVAVPQAPHHPTFSARAKQRVHELLDTGPMVGLSKQVDCIRQAEEAVARWHGVPYCLGTASGHGALHSALIGLEITSGAEVVTTPYSWGASVSCILHNNAVPIFADVHPDTGLLDPAAAEACITDRTRAILVTHIYGQPADMTALRQVSDRHGIALIEDGSQAHGARHRGVRVGAFGDASGFSCMGGKLLATSEAGYLLTREEDVYWKATLSGQHAGGTEHPGRASEPGFPDSLRPFIDSLNYTYRLSTINAVLLVEQISDLDVENEGRRRNREAFLAAIAGAESITAPSYSSDDDPVFHMVTLNYSPEVAGVSKEVYLKALQAEGAQVFSYIPTPLHRSPRLDPDYAGPAVMWSQQLRDRNVDYRGVELPGCDAKTRRSIEMTWNFTIPDDEAMRRLGDAFNKVEEHLQELRRYELAAG